MAEATPAMLQWVARLGRAHRMRHQSSPTGILVLEPLQQDHAVVAEIARPRRRPCMDRTKNWRKSSRSAHQASSFTPVTPVSVAGDLRQFGSHQLMLLPCIAEMAVLLCRGWGWWLAQHGCYASLNLQKISQIGRFEVIGALVKCTDTDVNGRHGLLSGIPDRHSNGA